MSSTEPPKVIGEVRSLADAEKELPAPKKPRIDAENGKTAGKKKKLRKKDRALPEKCSPADVLWQDIVSVIGREAVDQAQKLENEFDSPFSYHEVLDVKIVSLSSTGEAIGAPVKMNTRPWAIVTRFCLPGEIVRVKVYWNQRLHSCADLMEVVTPNLELRDNNRIKCKYFSKCGGCQYQMLSYDNQLKLKRDVVVKAYQTFSGLPESSMPLIQNTMGSPREYGYRTKLTPHFDAPPKQYRSTKPIIQDEKVERPEWLNVGFNYAGTHKVIDIEECPISTSVLNQGLPSVREKIFRSIHTYSKGVSLTLRDSLVIPKTQTPESTTSPDPVDALSTSLEEHICISNPKGTVREKVGKWIFEYGASSFFQTNNSVLVPLTDYVRDAIFPPAPPSGSITAPLPRPTHLVDAYCGAGLFSIILSPYFDTIAGIELSVESIKAAQHNAELNNIPASKISFREGDAADIFATVKRDFPPAKTVLVIDPPRKGCDDNFIRQLLDFRCGTIVYVSCNVHTQARDVGKIIQATEGEGEGRRYVVESLRGFDLFPQTAHVEGVAVLRLA
ncbi:hypothetical protein AX17_005867 [Amanita inopinata Kibby_2008]|nr:hypothetical protein AX17_005867 [Amanita inopinata Kibby_2008]